MEMFEYRWGVFLREFSGASRICLKTYRLHTTRGWTQDPFWILWSLQQSCTDIKRSTSHLRGGDQLRRGGGNTKDNLILFLLAPFIYSYK